MSDDKNTLAALDKVVLVLNSTFEFLQDPKSLAYPLFEMQGYYCDPRSQRFDGDDEDFDINDDPELDKAFCAVRDIIDGRLISQDAYESLVALFINLEDQSDANRGEARTACAEAFLLGFYARALVDNHRAVAS